MIFMLYGQPGSGKTTLGKLLGSFLKTPFVIDGDEFKNYQDKFLEKVNQFNSMGRIN